MPSGNTFFNTTHDISISSKAGLEISKLYQPGIFTMVDSRYWYRVVQSYIAYVLPSLSFPTIVCAAGKIVIYESLGALGRGTIVVPPPPQPQQQQLLFFFLNIILRK